MSPFLIAYLIGAGVVLASGFVYLFVELAMSGEYDYDEDLRKPTRLILLSPVWPIAALNVIYRLTMWAFDVEWRPFGP